MTAVALIDCDNFFVSCERLFRPDLKNCPVLILSSNDACVISRSEEAKQLGIKMGVPYFQIQTLCEEHDVFLFSSNFELYRDISRRVMSVVGRFSEHVEVYSIDEAFFELTKSDAETVAKEIRDTTCREVGVPVSVGVSETKTLAKIATHFAKPKTQGQGYHVLLSANDITRALKNINIAEVWGVGSRYTEKLQRFGINTAYNLIVQDDEWIQKRTNKLGLQTVMELRGKMHYKVGENTELRKSMIHSQSFGSVVKTFSVLRASVARHARAGAEMLRAEHALGGEIQVFVRAKYMHSNVQQTTYDTAVLTMHTNDTLVIVRQAVHMLTHMYRKGAGYTKAGVYVKDIIPEEAQPKKTLFHETTQDHRLMDALDTLQYRYDIALQTGAEMVDNSWRAKRNHLSPRCTTRWSEITKMSLHHA